MTFFRLLNYDVKYGILKRWYVLLITVLFAFSQYNTCHAVIESLKTFGIMQDNATVMDYLVFSFQGMYIYKFSPKDSFTIPLYWFIFQIGISYFIAYYTENDLRSNGRNILMACKSRLSWWFSKIIVCISSVLVYYILTIGLIVGMAIISGASLSWELSNDLSLSVFSYTLIYMDIKDILLITILLPVLTTISICLCQIVVSLVISPVLSFAAVCSFYVLSAYYTSPWLIGSYTMWQRSSYYIEEGISPDSGLLLSFTLLALALITGSYVIKTKDII